MMIKFREFIVEYSLLGAIKKARSPEPFDTERIIKDGGAAAQKFNEIGNGIDSTVFDHPHDENKVIRVAGAGQLNRHQESHLPALARLSWALHNQHDPHVPTIHAHASSNEYVQTEESKLRPLGNEHFQLGLHLRNLADAVDDMHGEYAHLNDQAHAKKKFEEHKAAVHNYFQANPELGKNNSVDSLVKTMMSATAHRKRINMMAHGKSPITYDSNMKMYGDAHKGNWMLGKDNTLKLNDPFA